MVSIKQTERFLRHHPRYFFHLLVRKAQFARRFRWSRRHGASDRIRPRPLVYKLMLNWKCNLRCPMCMLWGDVGWVPKAPDRSGDELDWGVVQKIFDGDLPFNSSFILSGGEPALYSQFDRLLLLLRQHRKFAIICTNGLTLDRHIEALDGNPYPTLLISLDGPQAINDRLRGDGVYAKVLQNLELLQSLDKRPYLAIQLTVMPENVEHLESFCEEMVAKGVDWILLNPGWFLSESQARNYEEFMRRHFDIEPTTHRGYMRRYDYDTADFQRQLERIKSRTWPIQIASHIKEPEWVQDFVDHPEAILGNRLCYKQWLRIDVLPDGRVAPCVQFPDLTVGDLTIESVDAVWNGPQNRRFQKVAYREPLPICAKCNNLYMYGPSKPEPIATD